MSQNEGYEIEFESELRHGKESVTVSALKFEKIPKVENKVQAEPPLNRKMTDTINFSK